MSCGQEASQRQASRLTSAPFVIVPVHTPEQIEAVRDLFREYGGTPHVEECVQGFEAEISELPGRYAGPEGVLLLALVADAPAGCVGLLPAGVEVVEMKRLFVRPAFRGRHIGEALVLAALESARARRIRRVRLSTLPTMAGAAAIYARHGFRPIAPFDDTLPAGVSFLELSL